jgi:uncharacterized membrane protein YhaH (DUF805 family)
MNFKTAIDICLRKYVDFYGRASRSELWFFIFFVFAVNLLAAVVDGRFFQRSGILSIIVALALFFQLLLSKSDGFTTWTSPADGFSEAFIPIVGAIVLLIWFCTPGTPGPNRFGFDPLKPHDPAL